MKKLLYLLPLLFMLVTISCQEEENVEEGVTPDENTFEVSSDFASTLELMAMYPGAWDDFLDGSSAISFQLPITVTVNNITLTIEEYSDLQLVMNVMNAFSNDDDALTFSFPVTVILADATTVTIENEQALLAIFAEYNTVDVDPVECADFVYPISYYVFNANQEEIDSVVINNDAELYLFLSTLTPTYFVSMEFPIQVIHNGETQTVTSNTQLQTLVDSCTEEIDEPYYDISIDELITGLQTCPWSIGMIASEGVDLTPEFELEYFTFNTDFSLFFTYNSNVYVGDYTVALNNDGNFEVSINVPLTFPVLHNTWVITDISPSGYTISFEDDDDLLILNQDCDLTPIEYGCLEDDMNQALQTCHWIVTSYGGTDLLLGYNFFFYADGTGEIISEGSLTSMTFNYEVGPYANNLIINFWDFSEPNQIFHDSEWIITDCDSTSFVALGDPNIEFEQECATCDLVFEECPDNTGIVTHFLNDYNECILSYHGLSNTATTNYTLTYYETEIDAMNGTNAIPNTYVALMDPQTVYVKIESPTSSLFYIVEITLVSIQNC